ncbi:hypothetical protein VTK56DRAFT_2877 [Thermocarpiscus australiensis]
MFSRAEYLCGVSEFHPSKGGRLSEVFKLFRNTTHVSLTLAPLDRYTTPLCLLILFTSILRARDPAIPSDTMCIAYTHHFTLCRPTGGGFHKVTEVDHCKYRPTLLGIILLHPNQCRYFRPVNVRVPAICPSCRKIVEAAERAELRARSESKNKERQTWIRHQELHELQRALGALVRTWAGEVEELEAMDENQWLLQRSRPERRQWGNPFAACDSFISRLELILGNREPSFNVVDARPPASVSALASVPRTLISVVDGRPLLPEDLSDYAESAADSVDEPGGLPYASARRQLSGSTLAADSQVASDQGEWEDHSIYRPEFSTSRSTIGALSGDSVAEPMSAMQSHMARLGPLAPTGHTVGLDSPTFRNPFRSLPQSADSLGNLPFDVDDYSMSPARSAMSSSHEHGFDADAPEAEHLSSHEESESLPSSVPELTGSFTDSRTWSLFLSEPFNPVQPDTFFIGAMQDNATHRSPVFMPLAMPDTADASIAATTEVSGWERSRPYRDDRRRLPSQRPGEARDERPDERTYERSDETPRPRPSLRRRPGSRSLRDSYGSL